MEPGQLQLLELPLEILDRIVSYFDNVFIRRGEVQWERMQRSEVHWSQFDKQPHPTDLERADHERCRVLCSLRLTCKAFNEVASTRLHPIPQLRLSQQSVDAFESFCHNPDVAKGIRGLKIALDYRPEMLAPSFDQFKRWQAEALFRVSSCCKYLLDQPSDGSELAGNDSLLAKMEQNHPLWDSFCRTDDLLSVCEGSEDQSLQKYQRLLRQSYDLYRARCEEQRQIIGDGSFVTTIARTVAKLPRAVEICFVNEEHGRSLREFGQPNHSLSTDAKTVEYLARPWAWEAIGVEKTFCPSAAIDAVRILTELPVSIWQHGGTLSRIHLQCFPCFDGNDFTLLHLDGVGPTASSMDDLRRAMSTAQSFRVGGASMSFRPTRAVHLAETKRAYITNYINCCLSSGALREIDLELFSLGRGNRDGSASSTGGMPIGKMLQGVDGSALVSLKISHASLSEADLLPFLQTLGDRLELCLLRKSHMHSGTWSECIEVLREKRAASSQDGVWIFFDMLSGGGFGDFDNEPPASTYVPESWEPSAAERRRYVLNKQASKYVNGMIDANPLSTERTTVLGI